MPFRCDQPAVPTVQQDDETARITRWDFAPGAATGWHTHGWPYFVVLLTDALLKSRQPAPSPRCRSRPGSPTAGLRASSTM